MSVSSAGFTKSPVNGPSPLQQNVALLGKQAGDILSELNKNSAANATGTFLSLDESMRTMAEDQRIVRFDKKSERFVATIIVKPNAGTNDHEMSIFSRIFFERKGLREKDYVDAYAMKVRKDKNLFKLLVRNLTASKAVDYARRHLDRRTDAQAVKFAEYIGACADGSKWAIDHFGAKAIQEQNADHKQMKWAMQVDALASAHASRGYFSIDDYAKSTEYQTELKRMEKATVPECLDNAQRGATTKYPKLIYPKVTDEEYIKLYGFLGTDQRCEGSSSLRVVLGDSTPGAAPSKILTKNFNPFTMSKYSMQQFSDATNLLINRQQELSSFVNAVPMDKSGANLAVGEASAQLGEMSKMLLQRDIYQSFAMSRAPQERLDIAARDNMWLHYYYSACVSSRITPDDAATRGVYQKKVLATSATGLDASNLQTFATSLNSVLDEAKAFCDKVLFDSVEGCWQTGDATNGECKKYPCLDTDSFASSSCASPPIKQMSSNFGMTVRRGFTIQKTGSIAAPRTQDTNLVYSGTYNWLC